MYFIFSTFVKLNVWRSKETNDIQLSKKCSILVTKDVSKLSPKFIEFRFSHL